MIKHFSKTTLIISLLLLSLFKPAYAGQNEDFPIPNAVVSLGDSLSAGLFADLDRNILWNPVALLLLMERLISADSLSDVSEFEAKEFSWSTGKTLFPIVNSHYEILSRNGNVNKGFKNFSVSGQKVEEVLTEQVSAFSSWRERHLNESESVYVTYLAGANDLCAEDLSGLTDTPFFERNVHAAFDNILSGNPYNFILVSSIPNAASLREVAAHETTLLNEEMTCDEFWRSFELCPTLTYKTEDPQIMSAVDSRLKEFNNILETKVNEMREQYGDRIRFSPETYEQEILADNLSIDCFHPNMSGQARMAKETFKQSWWPQLK